MNYHIGRDGQQLGEFSEDAIRAGLREGRFLPTDLTWAEGMSGWQALGSLPQFQAAQAPFPSAQQPYVQQPSYGGGGVPLTGVDVLPPANAPAPNGLAVTSLVCGIIGVPGSLCCFGVVLSITAVITGHIALARIKRYPTPQSPKGMAIAGLVMGYLGIAICLAQLARAGTSWPEIQRQFNDAYEKAKQQQQNQGH